MRDVARFRATLVAYRLLPALLGPAASLASAPYKLSASRSVPVEHGGRPNGFLFKLVLADGTPAEPPTLDTTAPNWRLGDTIPLGRKTLRVVAVRPAEALDGDPMLVVEDPDSKGH